MTNREAERRALRKARILDRQSYRRANKRRIDYFPSPEAAAVIDAIAGRPPDRMRYLFRRLAGLPDGRPRPPNGAGLSAVIDRLLLAASELPEFQSSAASGSKR